MKKNYKYRYETFFNDIKFLWWVYSPVDKMLNKDKFYRLYFRKAAENLKLWREKRFKTESELAQYNSAINNTINKLFKNQQRIAHEIIKESYRTAK